MHRCQNCGDELNFDWGSYPKRCDVCLTRYFRFEDSRVVSRNLRERMQYHRRRREEDGQIESPRHRPR
jgi:hypothetical protein